MSHILTTQTAAPRRASLLVLSGLAALSCIAAVSVASAGTGATAAANTVTERDVPHLVVRYDEQSLSTDYGADSLYRRIVSAARQVCHDDSSRDLHLQQLAQECRRRAVEGAIQQVHNPRLAAVYIGHSKHGRAS